MFKFSKNSIDKLNTADKRLQEVAHLALQYSEVDFGISWGHRTIREQQRLYTFGRGNPLRDDIVTNCDGVNKISKHNYTPALAIDVFAWVDGDVTWDPEYYKEIYKAFKKASEELNISLSWGGNWKKKDYPHYQLK